MKGARVIIAVAVLALSGCDSETSRLVSKCEALLLPTLKAPSTYKLIDKTIGLPGPSGARDVFLEFDAANVYNTPIRDRFWCVVDKSGAADVGGGGVDAIADNLDAAADEISAAPTANHASNPFAEPTVSPDARSDAADDTPICDRARTPKTLQLMNEMGVDCSGE